jgi:hypothetical protein
VNSNLGLRLIKLALSEMPRDRTWRSYVLAHVEEKDLAERFEILADLARADRRDGFGREMLGAVLNGDNDVIIAAAMHALLRKKRTSDSERALAKLVIDYLVWHESTKPAPPPYAPVNYEEDEIPF